MPHFSPIRGVRAIERTVRQFLTLSVDDYSPEQIQEILNSNKNSFLQIIQPTWDETLSPKERFRKVRKNIEAFSEREVLRQDKSSFYVYQQQKGEQTIRGLLGAISIEDFKQGKIKKHEETREKRKRLFAEYLKEVQIHAEPVLLTYPEIQRVELLTELEISRKPAFVHTDEKGVEHKLWQITDRMAIKQIKDSIEKVPEVYIADGHHRLGSSALFTEYMQKENPKFTGRETFNYALALMVTDHQLVIKDYNRLLKDLGGKSKKEFLAFLEQKFRVIPKGDELYVPSKKHHISMYLEGEFYALYVEKAFRGTPEGLGDLDAYLLEKNILQPFFGIQDTRTDDRIDFLPGTGDALGIEKLKTKVDEGKYVAAFAMAPVSVSDLCRIADLGLKMPPKSTFIEPKLPSGLVLFDLKP